MGAATQQTHMQKNLQIHVHTLIYGYKLILMSSWTPLAIQHFKKFITRRREQHDYRFHFAFTLKNLHISKSMGS